MKKTIALILYMLFFVTMTGCSNTAPDGSASDDVISGMDTDNPTSGDTLSGMDKPASGSTITAADYYHYLKENIVSKHELTPEEPIDITSFDNSGRGRTMRASLANEVKTGTVSADVRDYDNDGELEMLVLRLINILKLDTCFAPYCFDDPANAQVDVDDRAVELYITYLDTKDGKIYERSTQNFTVFLLDGWGSLYAGLEKIGDQYYLFSTVYSENMSSYGPAYTVVAQIGGAQGCIAPEYASKISSMGISQQQAEQMFGAFSPINLDTLSISELGVPENPSYEECQERLGNRLLCFFALDYPEWGGERIIEKVTDCTNLRHYLENGASDWKQSELPEGYEKEAPSVSSGLTDIISELDQAAETAFSKDELMLKENEDGSVSTKVNHDQLVLSLTWDTSADHLQEIMLKTDGGLEDGVWYSVKDALLKLSAFGFTESEIAPLLGEVSFNNYVNGVTVGGYTVQVASIVGTFIKITRN